MIAGAGAGPGRRRPSARRPRSTKIARDSCRRWRRSSGRAGAGPPPTLVGRYSAGGANYSIFSDGSIEAETDQGAFKFGSMTEFKAFIAAKRV